MALVRRKGMTAPAVIAKGVDCTWRYTYGQEILRNGVLAEKCVHCSLSPERDVVARPCRWLVCEGRLIDCSLICERLWHQLLVRRQARGVSERRGEQGADAERLWLRDAVTSCRSCISCAAKLAKVTFVVLPNWLDMAWVVPSHSYCCHC